MWKSTLVFLAVIGVSLAALGFAPLEPKPDKFKDVEGCYISDNDVVIPFGQSVPSKSSCQEYRCNHDLINIASCGVVAASLPCKIVKDLKKPYPDCCPKISCP